MAVVKITWLQILARANNRLLDPVSSLVQCSEDIEMPRRL